MTLVDGTRQTISPNRPLLHYSLQARHNMVATGPLSGPLFSPDLIGTDVVTSFPEGYTVRPLERGDYAKGFLDCLGVLSDVGDVSQDRFEERFDWMKTQGQGVHYHVAIEHENRVVGTGAIIVERKL